MYEGFDSYDDYINSLSDGFANMFNDKVPEDMELICNQDAYEMLLKAFGDDVSIRRVKNVTDIEINKMLNYINDPEYDYGFTKGDIIDCLQYALKQSVGL